MASLQWTNQIAGTWKFYYSLQGYKKHFKLEYIIFKQKKHFFLKTLQLYFRTKPNLTGLYVILFMLAVFIASAFVILKLDMSGQQFHPPNGQDFCWMLPLTASMTRSLRWGARAGGCKWQADTARLAGLSSFTSLLAWVKLSDVSMGQWTAFMARGWNGARASRYGKSGSIKTNKVLEVRLCQLTVSEVERRVMGQCTAFMASSRNWNGVGSQSMSTDSCQQGMGSQTPDDNITNCSERKDSKFCLT